MNQTITSHTQVGDYRDAVQIVASHCCVCRRKLTDASSVQNGIGPSCSNKYYSDAHTPSEEEILHATGWLAASNLPDDVLEAVLAQTDKGNGRQACNILVYFASAHYEDRDTVFKVSAIVRAFGYDKLADKLEEDRTKVSLRFGDYNGTPIIALGVSWDKWDARRDLMKVPGAVSLAKVGRKYAFSFPTDERTRLLVECILGFHYGYALATVGKGFLKRDTAGIQHIPRRSRSDLQAFSKPKTGTTAAVATTTSGKGGAVHVVVQASGRIEFWSPYNPAWLADMKTQVIYRNRRWNGSCWIFERSVLQTIKDLANTHYGTAI